jgi:IS4 transposase
VDTAIDGHAWLYYGEDNTVRVSTVDPDQGTDKAYKFLTLSVIGDDGEKFTLAVRQVASKQEELEAVKDLAEIADERLYLRDVFLDRGFYGTLYAQALTETGVNFVIRAQKGSRSKTLWKNAGNGVNVERNVEMSRSYAPYESVVVTRFVVPAGDDVDDEYVAFITNRELTRWQARRVGATYKRRWGIETSYRVTGDFLPKTASKDFALRQFYYQMAVLLYNVWVLVNAVVAESLGVAVDASPPVTAKYLLIVMRNKHREETDVT